MHMEGRVPVGHHHDADSRRDGIEFCFRVGDQRTMCRMTSTELPSDGKDALASSVKRLSYRFSELTIGESAR
jgi:hypothetical protein